MNTNITGHWVKWSPCAIVSADFGSKAGIHPRVLGDMKTCVHTKGTLLASVWDQIFRLHAWVLTAGKYIDQGLTPRWLKSQAVPMAYLQSAVCDPYLM